MHRVYLRRRITVVIVLLAAVFGLIKVVDSPQYSCDVDNATAIWGDSLWSIAERHCSGNVGAAVEDMIGLNRGVRIQAGQVVDLP